jgi:hypothetical protein
MASSIGWLNADDGPYAVADTSQVASVRAWLRPCGVTTCVKAAGRPAMRCLLYCAYLGRGAAVIFLTEAGEKFHFLRSDS